MRCRASEVLGEGWFFGQGPYAALLVRSWSLESCRAFFPTSNLEPKT